MIAVLCTKKLKPARFELAPPERPGPYPGALDQLGQSSQFVFVL